MSMNDVLNFANWKPQARPPVPQVLVDIAQALGYSNRIVGVEVCGDIVYVEFAVRDGSDQFSIPTSVLQAEDPVYAVRLWQAERKVENISNLIEERQRELAELERKLVTAKNKRDTILFDKMSNATTQSESQ